MRFITAMTGQFRAHTRAELSSEVYTFARPVFVGSFVGSFVGQGWFVQNE
jgi:hypothetical protein